MRHPAKVFWGLVAILVASTFLPANTDAQEEPERAEFIYGELLFIRGGGNFTQLNSDQSDGLYEYTNLGAGLSVEYVNYVIATGRFWVKFINTKGVGDPEFKCIKKRNSCQSHRLGLQGDVFFDPWNLGPFNLGIAGGVFFRGTSLGVLRGDDPFFEKRLSVAYSGVALTVRHNRSYLALAPVMGFSITETMNEERANSKLAGAMAAARINLGFTEILASGRYMAFLDSSDFTSGQVSFYHDLGQGPVETRDASVLDANLSFSMGVGGHSFLTLGPYIERFKGTLEFFDPTGSLVQERPRELVNIGFEVSFRFEQY